MKRFVVNASMHTLMIALVIFFLNQLPVWAQVKTYEIDDFEKVIVSPHIQVEFRYADTPRVEITDKEVSLEKLHVEVSGKTLHLYLDGARTYTKNEKIKNNHTEIKHPLYMGTEIRAIVYYKQLNNLSLRGEQRFKVPDPITTEKFRLTLYGETEVQMERLEAGELVITTYGESELRIKSGAVKLQKITTYGESEINTLGLETERTKITSYGENEIEINAVKELKVTSYGEARIRYKGNPDIRKGIVAGDVEFRHIND